MQTGCDAKVTFEFDIRKHDDRGASPEGLFAFAASAVATVGDFSCADPSAELECRFAASLGIVNWERKNVKSEGIPTMKQCEEAFSSPNDTIGVTLEVFFKLIKTPPMKFYRDMASAFSIAGSNCIGGAHGSVGIENLKTGTRGKWKADGGFVSSMALAEEMYYDAYGKKPGGAVSEDEFSAAFRKDPLSDKVTMVRFFAFLSKNPDAFPEFSVDVYAVDWLTKRAWVTLTPRKPSKSGYGEAADFAYERLAGGMANSDEVDEWTDGGEKDDMVAIIVRTDPSRFKASESEVFKKEIEPGNLETESGVAEWPGCPKLQVVICMVRPDWTAEWGHVVGDPDRLEKRYRPRWLDLVDKK